MTVTLPFDPDPALAELYAGVDADPPSAPRLGVRRGGRAADGFSFRPAGPRRRRARAVPVRRRTTGPGSSSAGPRPEDPRRPARARAGPADRPRGPRPARPGAPARGDPDPGPPARRGRRADPRGAPVLGPAGRRRRRAAGWRRSPPSRPSGWPCGCRSKAGRSRPWSDCSATARSAGPTSTPARRSPGSRRPRPSTRPGSFATAARCGTPSNATAEDPKQGAIGRRLAAPGPRSARRVDRPDRRPGPVAGPGRTGPAARRGPGAGPGRAGAALGCPRRSGVGPRGAGPRDRRGVVDLGRVRRPGRRDRRRGRASRRPPGSRGRSGSRPSTTPRGPGQVRHPGQPRRADLPRRPRPIDLDGRLGAIRAGRSPEPGLFARDAPVRPGRRGRPTSGSSWPIPTTDLNGEALLPAGFLDDLMRRLDAAIGLGLRRAARPVRPRPARTTPTWPGRRPTPGSWPSPWPARATRRAAPGARGVARARRGRSWGVADAFEVAHRRRVEREFGPYDGRLARPPGDRPDPRRSSAPTTPSAPASSNRSPSARSSSISATSSA